LPHFSFISTKKEQNLDPTAIKVSFLLYVNGAILSPPVVFFFWKRDGMSSETEAPLLIAYDFIQKVF